MDIAIELAKKIHAAVCKELAEACREAVQTEGDNPDHDTIVVPLLMAHTHEELSRLHRQSYYGWREVAERNEP